MNFATALVAAIVAAAFIGIVTASIRNKKKGKSCCGGGCSGCGMSGACHR